MENLIHEVDLCVVGGGIAGLLCAVAAARKGISVAIMQDRPMFGGNASSEIRMHICGAHGKDNKETGIIEELFLDNYYRNTELKYPIWDSVMFEKALLEKNIQMFLNCSCLDCEMNGNKIVSIKGWQTTTQRYHTIKAKYFADCSGDSILAPLTGAEFMLGREAKSEYNESIPPEKADKKTMGMSCLLEGRETASPKKFIPPVWAHEYPDDSCFPDVEQTVRDNFWWIELGGTMDSIGDTEEIRTELLKTAFGVWDHIKNKGDHGAENWELDWIGFLPGKRESRRYKGAYVITENDVTAGGKFDDVIAYGGWTMDDHFPEGFNHKSGHPTIYHPAPSPWGITFRSLYSKNIENLTFAGRNISVTHAALSSSRVMATCGILGQALGTAIADAVKENRHISKIDIRKLQQELMADDCFIPYIKREISPLCKKANVNCEIVRNAYERGDENLWIGHDGDYIEYTFENPEYTDNLRIVFDSDLNREYRQNMPCYFPLNETRFKVPKTLVKEFTVEITDENGNTTSKTYENHQRFVRVPIGKKVTKIKLIPNSTWGSEDYRIFCVEPVGE